MLKRGKKLQRGNEGGFQDLYEFIHPSSGKWIRIEAFYSDVYGNLNRIVSFTAI